MYCQRMHATIPVATCLGRQAQGKHYLYEGVPLECRDCEQGKRAAAGQFGDEDVDALCAQHGTRSKEQGEESRRSSNKEQVMKTDGKKPTARTLHYAVMKSLETYQSGKEFTLDQLGDDVVQIWRKKFEKRRLSHLMSRIVRADLGVVRVQNPGRQGPAIFKISDNAIFPEPDRFRPHELEERARSKRRRTAWPREESSKAQKYKTFETIDQWKVTLDLSKHQDLYKQIEKRATAQVRNIEQQIVWELKNAFNDNNLSVQVQCPYTEFEIARNPD